MLHNQASHFDALEFDTELKSNSVCVQHHGEHQVHARILHQYSGDVHHILRGKFMAYFNIFSAHSLHYSG